MMRFAAAALIALAFAAPASAHEVKAGDLTLSGLEIRASLGPVTEKMRRLMADPAEVDAALEKGAERAGEVAEATIAEVKRIVGFWGARR